MLVCWSSHQHGEHTHTQHTHHQRTQSNPVFPSSAPQMLSFIWSCCFVHHSSSSVFPECAQPFLIKARARRGSDLCAEQTCRSMDAVSQGTLPAKSSQMLLYSLIVWLLHFVVFFPKELSRWMGALDVPMSTPSPRRSTPHLSVKAL